MSGAVDREPPIDPAVARAVRELTEEADDAMTDHPGLDALVDYQEGRLQGAEAEGVRRHLVSCPECARQVLELEAFDSDDDPDLRPTPAETREDWATFQRRCVGEPPGARVLEMTGRGATGAPEPPPVRPGWMGWTPLAAAVLFAVTGAGFWYSGIADRAAPAADTPAHPHIFDLLPEGEGSRRDTAVVRRIEVPPGMDALVARLNLGDQTPHAAYRAEILDAAGEPAWSQADLRRQPTGHFALLVPRRDLPAGRYQVRLYGLKGGAEQVLATYSFELHDLPDP